MSDTSNQTPQASGPDSGPEAPPVSFGGMLLRIGPGLIIAGNIVGSGELIATTASGAQAGFWLLWLIVIGCVIKVFTQVELGRYTIVNGKTTMAGLNEVPGPRLGKRGNWLAWYWLVMFLASLAQLGGIVGGVGQALSISAPLTEEGKQYNEIVDARTEYTVKKRLAGLLVVKAIGEAPDPEPNPALDSVHAAIIELERFDAEENAAIKKAKEDGAAIPERDYSRKLGLTTRVSDEAEKVTADPTGYVARAQGYLVEMSALLDQLTRLGKEPDNPYDDRLWAAMITLFTAVALILGRYGMIQSFSTALVVLFTLVTIVNLILLQNNDILSVTSSELADGLKFQLPPATEGRSAEQALETALKTLGIIGVGASELVAYPYWCLEKGYARFTGPRDDSSAWADRARGWMRVMQFDAWASMAIYTFATIAFYLVGAATLGRFGLKAEGTEMVRTLAVMYEPVFGSYAPTLFLFGAVAVLYSTFFVANASHARVCSDALRIFGFNVRDEAHRQKIIKVFSGVFPFLCLTVYMFIQAPAALVMLSGLMQAVMLPMLAGAALFFRYKRCDARIAPGRLWDALLWLSGLGMLAAGAALIYLKF